MPIRDLLAVVDTGDQDGQFLQDALAFAAFHQARLSFVVLSAMPAEAYALTPPFVFLDDYTEAVEAKEARIVKAAGAANIEVRTISDQPAVIFSKAAVYARYADLVLVGPRSNYEHPPIRRETIESILFASGRPVLVLPNGHRAGPVDHIAIGWNATREATLALREAKALAEPGAKIDVLVLNGKPSEKGHGSEPGADIGRHLARHGFDANVVALSRGDGSDADALIRGAREHGASLLALGAYGHSRLREMILGGVTRELLDGAEIPLLFAH
jgi:nucleotide-binding universal stress UspA family protein